MENGKQIEQVDRQQPQEAGELIELGSVTSETQGGFAGHSLDGGFGFKKP